MTARSAAAADAVRIAAIYNHGIEEGTATIETRLRSTDEAAWFDGTHPAVVVEAASEVIAFAATFGYRGRACYAGIAKFSVCVDRRHQCRGAGRLVEALLREAAPAGFWKLVSRVFPENTASRALVSCLESQDRWKSPGRRISRTSFRM